MNAIVPRHPVQTRLATAADLPFIDALQKRHGKQLGFMATSWIEARIAKGEVIVAEEVASCELRVGSADGDSHSLATSNSQLTTAVGYIISTDKYTKREELGIVLQLCVDPSKQRGLVGAMLVQAAFERAAYGCKLFCLWCAQDIAANQFWESIGFVPLAYRAGSEKKARVHIFWQKRVRAGDETTPWWFPSSTTGGAMGAGRIVLPIPPGKHWSDELPILLPNDDATDGAAKQIEGPREKRKRTQEPAPVKRPATRTLGAPRMVAAEPAPAPVLAKPKKERPAAKNKTKNDPRLVAAARELRDRWLEHVNEHHLLGTGKYDVTRMIAAPVHVPALLPAA